MGLTLRMGFERHTERLLVCTSIFFALTATPVMVLGYTNKLWPAPLAACSLVTSLIAFVVSARGNTFRKHVEAIIEEATLLAFLPLEGLGLAVKARSFVVLGLIASIVLAAGSLVLTILAPSECHDGFFYHEPMVGFAIQNHGFQMVELPQQVVVQQVNGFPRLCESLALWFCIFTDRRLIEIGNTLVAPGMIFMTYALAHRVCRDKVPCMGWGAAFLLIPAVHSQLRTTLIDCQVAFFLVSAIYFATQTRLMTRDVLACSLNLGLCLAAKGTGLVWCPPIAIILLVRFIMQGEASQTWRRFALLAGSNVILAAIASITLVRNYIAFRNPVWPVSYEIRSLGISWPGLLSMERMGAVRSLSALIDMKYHHPTGGVGDIIVRDYGYGVPWVIVPLVLLAFVVFFVRWLRRGSSAQWSGIDGQMVLLFGLLALYWKLPPGPTVARYNLHLVAIAMTCVAALASLIRKSERFHEGAVAATLVLSLVTWYWTRFFHGVDLTSAGMSRMLHATAAERATMNAVKFQMPQATAKAREAELGPGDRIAFTDEELFIGTLWNERFDNHVEYHRFRDPVSFIERLDERCVKWVVVGQKSAAQLTLRKYASDWSEVGVAVTESNTLAYRRVRPCPE